jgi:hypothetical protein
MPPFDMDAEPHPEPEATGRSSELALPDSPPPDPPLPFALLLTTCEVLLVPLPVVFLREDEREVT